MPDTQTDETLDALQDTLAPHADTLRQAPGATIRPALGADVEASRQLAAHVLELRGDAQAFDMEGELGRGGMGVVHLATQRALGRKVAVKTLHPGLTGDPDALRLLQEAWITGAVEHPNVVPIHDVEIREDGAPMVAFKRIEGAPWSVFLADAALVRAHFGVEDALEWHLRTLMQVCTAIHFAHARGILHRDLKPDNVMIGGYGEVYVLDWGIAVSLRDDGAQRLPLARDSRGVAGTPAYMAPEMIKGDGAQFDARTDVYLLGGLLHAILTGRPPHRGTTPLALAMDATRDTYEFPPSTPSELATLASRALSPAQSARFESAEAMRQALQKFLDHRHSDRLADGAAVRLEALLQRIERPRTGLEDQLEVYRLFGECRFGFKQALESWSGNLPAARGLVSATQALIEWELAANNPEAAAAALAELESPPPELVARVAEARAVAEAAARRTEEAQRLAQRFDATVGRRTRIALALLMCGLWMALPLRRLFFGGRPNYETMRWAPLIYLGAAVVLGWFFRRILLSHAFNRTIMGVITVAVIGQWALFTADDLAGLPAEIAAWQSQFLAFITTGLLSVCLVPRLAFAAVTYLVFFMLGAAHPDWRDVLLVLGNTALLLNAALIWGSGLGKGHAR